MPILTVATEATVDDLLSAVQELDEKELAEFEAGFEQIRLRRNMIVDQEAADIVSSHRLPHNQQARVRELLLKNREEGLTGSEELELDAYMDAMDQALEETADQLLQLANIREQTSDMVSQ